MKARLIPQTMKVNVTFVCVCLFSILFFTACKKDQLTKQHPSSVSLVADENSASKILFAKVLAKAIKEEESLRSFIKTEALKQFDKDYDVLFQAVKDKQISPQHTFYETLLKYADRKEQFDSACDKLPLLTIYVPELPDFNAESWNINTQIPTVALSTGKISIYDAEGKENNISPRLIPGFPVLVIKNNERVVLNGTTNYFADAHAKKKNSPFYANEKFSFAFADDAFDGLNNKVSNTATGRVTPTIDQVNVDAYNSGSEWHRDFIYYGITPTNPIGRFTNRYSEFITSFMLTKPEHLDLISDQDNDPKPFTGFVPYNEPQWIEGYFEFRISIFINAKNAVGQELRKAFTAKGSDLFQINYRDVGLGYIYESVTPIDYRPNIEILPWDLEQYGIAWKFAVSEYDPTEEFTRTVTHTSTYGANFEINTTSGDKVKVGSKFGLSATSTSSTTYQYKTTTGSDDLAEGVLDFRSPVITSIRTYFPNRKVYTTYEVSTGIVSLSVEPIKIY